jgi:hypothetical protein
MVITLELLSLMEGLLLLLWSALASRSKDRFTQRCMGAASLAVFATLPLFGMSGRWREAGFEAIYR